MKSRRRNLSKSKPMTVDEQAKLDEKVRAAVFSDPDDAKTKAKGEDLRRARRIWTAYDATTGSARNKLGRVLLAQHAPRHSSSTRERLGADGKRKSVDLADETKADTENPFASTLANVGRARRRALDIPASYLKTPRGGMIRASAGAEPTIRTSASNQVLSAALALQRLANDVIARRGDDRADPHQRGQVLAAYQAAFHGPAPDHPPWLGVFIMSITTAKHELLQRQATHMRLGTVAEEVCFRETQVDITPTPDGSSIRVIDPRGRTLDVANHQIVHVRTKRDGAVVLAELHGDAPEAELRKFREDTPDGATVVHTLERQHLAVRRRERDQDDDELEAVLAVNVGDQDQDVRLAVGPPEARWQRVAMKDTEPGIRVRLTLEQAARSRGLTASQILDSIRRQIPAWSPLPAYADDEQLLAWLLMKLGTGRGGGRTGGLSVGSITRHLMRPKDLARAIERDAGRKDVSAEQEEQLTKVVQRIRESAPQAFVQHPDRPTPRGLPNT